MNARSFFDTNILVYADDKRTPAKQSRAIDLVAEHRRDGTGVISLQVLQEYFVTVTRKPNVDSPLARRKVEILSEFEVVVPEVADILAAIDLHRLHAFSFLGCSGFAIGAASWLSRPIVRGFSGRP